MFYFSTMNSSILMKTEFSVRIVVCDHYLTKPIPGIDVIYSEFRGSDIKQVPVLRIFGPAADGHKVCLHIHGVFPYFYIPCPTRTPEPQFLYQIAASLDKALNIALKQTNSNSQHVYKISLVKGLPFYGYHDKEHLYLKVFLYNPGLIRQAVELCNNGAILGQTFQPHESHLNFNLQFFIDFNLFGMSNINLQHLKFRNKSMSQNSDDPAMSEESSLKAESMCYYEADCMASHIINRLHIGRGDGIENPGLEEVWNQEKERRKQLNISMASKSLTQSRLKCDETESHYKFEQMFWIRLANLLDKPVDGVNVANVISEVHYPAESMEGSQLFSAVDVSIHQPDSNLSNTLSNSVRRENDGTIIHDIDATIVDESVALNSSLSVHYSQVDLDSEDMDLLDMLKDMDDSIEDDSVMGTPANLQEETDESDDAEYSQIFNDETILDDTILRKVPDEENDSPKWNDTFWEGANIPQLDGACDDEHTKKVHKRKMKSLRLGLSRTKRQQKEHDEEKIEAIKTEINSKILENTVVTKTVVKDENQSELTNEIDIIDNSLDEGEKAEVETHTDLNVGSIFSDNSMDSEIEETNQDKFSITSLVNTKFVQPENPETNFENVKLESSKIYDIQQKYEPVAGPSVLHPEKHNKSFNISLDCSTSSDDNLGITSFYNVSKLLNNTAEEKYFDNSVNEINNGIDIKSEMVESTAIIKKECNSVLSLDKSIKVHLKKNAIVLTPKLKPPTKAYIDSSLETYNIPKIKHPQPYYSNYKDVGDKVEIGQMLLKLRSKLAHDQKPFENNLNIITIEEWRQLLFSQNNDMSGESNINSNALKALLAGNRKCILEPIKKPPNAAQVKQWSEKKEQQKSQESDRSDKNGNAKYLDELDNSQAIGLDEVINNSTNLESTDKEESQPNENLEVTMQCDGSYLCFGSGSSRNEENATPSVETNFLTVMVLELHTSIRGDYHPDPMQDSIRAVFMTITNDCPSEHFLSKSVTEIFVTDELPHPKIFDRCVFNIPITYVNNEKELLEKVIDSVRRHDPDIMCGYEIEMNSWGYLFERSQVLGVEMIAEVSRITQKNRQKRGRGSENDFEGRILGRVTFNVWRLFRHELALSSYSFENCMYEVLKERVPKYNYSQLADWWNDESRMLRWIPMEYYLTRLSGTIRMLEKLDIISRTAELARLFGLQWWEVLSRGSQVRVESLMLRAARPLNLLALSPGARRRAAMRAPECLPLILEPESRFYADPVIVLDFQSLYPSMMIAYNYCFSTCIGRVQNINGDSSYEFGAWRLKISKAKLEALVKNGLVHWSPVGVGFVKPEVRRGVLPALLRRILAARQAVKRSMKMQTDETLKKTLHSRQLGLKLIANVTYGYTAANFSGRMPCVEIGDSVVAKGRETLERAIKMVENNKQWNAKVVYGDTDSMFVAVAGGARADAFRVGRAIADAVSADNPAPVALKLEKVYQPCILQTKKRYVGFMYETPDQDSPVYEAKGIETVRRDGCPAGVKLLQRSLCELFSSGDVSRVKAAATRALRGLARGATSPHELFLTREYRGPGGYRPGAAAPPNEIAKRLAARDARARPRAGWRVAWAVCAGAPGAPLARLARRPADLCAAAAPRPLAAYYATRVLLPPLHRCFSLLGVDVFKWWTEIGYAREAGDADGDDGGDDGIARYLCRERCAGCGARAAHSACAACAARPRVLLAALCTRLRDASAQHARALQTCGACCGRGAAACANTECAALWRRRTAARALGAARDALARLPPALGAVDF